MPRKKKVEETVVVEAPKKKPRKPKSEKPAEPKYFVDGHGDVREYTEPLKQFEIDWDKIAANVRDAADMVEQFKKTSKKLNERPSH